MGVSLTCLFVYSTLLFFHCGLLMLIWTRDGDGGEMAKKKKMKERMDGLKGAGWHRG